MGSFDVLAATTKSSGGFGSTELIVIVIIVIGFYMLLIRPQRRRQQQAQQQRNSLRVGSRVTTTAGMRATVVAIDDESGDVVLEAAPGVELRFMKRAIMSVDTPGDEPEETAGPEEDGEDGDGADTGDAYFGSGEDGAGDSAEDGAGGTGEAEQDDEAGRFSDGLDDVDAAAGKKD
jgi:preprotein translocase subunit YajC